MSTNKKPRISRGAWILIAFGLTVGLVFILTFYFLFIYEEVPLDRIAQDFCACAETPEVLSSEKIDSKEDFYYLKNIQTCFGDKFAHYDDGLTYEEELEFVAKVRDKIFETCPDKIGNVFSTR